MLFGISASMSFSFSAVRGYVSSKSVVRADRTKEKKIRTKMDGERAMKLNLYV